MPIYEYECKNCNTRFEKLQSMTSDPLTECLNCGGGPIRRVLHPVGVIFKGSGWYITDNRKSSGSGESSSKSTGEPKSDSSSSSSGSDTKPGSSGSAGPSGSSDD